MEYLKGFNIKDNKDDSLIYTYNEARDILRDQERFSAISILLELLQKDITEELKKRETDYNIHPVTGRMITNTTLA